MATSAQMMMGTYELVRRLGTGGMGEVWLARQRGAAGFARDVAIKRLLPQAMEQPDVVQMFIEEAQITGRLRHPNVVNVVELGAAESGELYLVLEYVDGIGLHKLLRVEHSRQFSVRAALALGRDVALALHAAHTLKDENGEDLGLVHRDVTPSNVMVDRYGHVKLMDFGIAKVRAKSNQTEAGIIKGKVAYLAPEQLEGKVDPRSDLFSLGLVLWEAVAKQQARSAGSDAAMVAKVATSEIPSIQTKLPDLDPAVVAVIDKACAIDPDHRYQTGQEMAQALLDALAKVSTMGGVEAAREELGKLVASEMASADVASQGNTLASRTGDSAHAVALTLHSLVLQGDGVTLSRKLDPSMIKAVLPPDARSVTSMTSRSAVGRGRRRSALVPLLAVAIAVAVGGAALLRGLRPATSPGALASPRLHPNPVPAPQPAPPPVVAQVTPPVAPPPVPTPPVAPPHIAGPHEGSAAHVHGPVRAAHVATAGANDNTPGHLRVFVRGSGGLITISGPGGTFHGEDTFQGNLPPGRYTIHVVNQALRVDRQVPVTIAPNDDNRQVIDLEHAS